MNSLPIREYQVDNLTRIRLQDSRWASKFREKLLQAGHRVVDLGVASIIDPRDDDEKKRAADLVEQMRKQM